MIVAFDHSEYALKNGEISWACYGATLDEVVKVLEDTGSDPTKHVFYELGAPVVLEKQSYIVKPYQESKE